MNRYYNKGPIKWGTGDPYSLFGNAATVSPGETTPNKRPRGPGPTPRRQTGHTKGTPGRFRSVALRPRLSPGLPLSAPLKIYHSEGSKTMPRVKKQENAFLRRRKENTRKKERPPQALARRMNSAIFLWSLTPGLDSTPLDTSTANGLSIRIASETLSTVSPPEMIRGTGV